MGAYKPHLQYEDKENTVPRYVVIQPAECWNRLFGLAFTTLNRDARASFSKENMPDWVVDSPREDLIHQITKLPIYRYRVQLNKVPTNWYVEQGMTAPSREDETTITFEIAEYTTEYDILVLLGHDSPLHVSSIRRAFYSREKTEKQQLDLYKKKTDLRIISMVINYHEALYDVTGTRGRSIPVFQNWQKNLAKSHQPHLFDEKGDPIQNIICPLPSQIQNVATRDGLNTVLLRVSGFTGRPEPYKGPLHDGREDTSQMIICDEAIASMIRTSKTDNIKNVSKGVVADAEMAKSSLQHTMSMVPVVTGMLSDGIFIYAYDIQTNFFLLFIFVSITEMHSQWHAGKTINMGFWDSFIEAARNLLGYVGLNPEQEGKGEDDKKHLRGVLLRAGYIGIFIARS